MFRLLVFVLMLLSAGLAIARPLVLVSVPPQQGFLRALGADLVDIETLVAKGFSPENYQPGARQIARLAAADLFVRVGLPFEKQLIPRLEAINPRLMVLDMRDGIPLLSEDPHVWTDPIAVRSHVQRLAEVLGDMLPDDRAEILENLSEFSAELTQLDKEIHLQLDGLRSRQFLVYHPAWAYFARRYDLQQLSVEQHGREPDARQLADLIKQARTAGIITMILQPQHNSRSARVVADAIGAKIEMVDPLSEQYFETLRQLVQVLKNGS